MKVNDLLQQGIVVQDPDDSDKVIYNLPIYIKKAAVEAGCFEAFAVAYGWAPTIKNEDGEETENPVGIFYACNKVVWNFVATVFQGALKAKLRSEADEASEQLLKDLL